MTRINVPRKAEETCKNCGTLHILPVEYDEDGGYVQIETEHCHDDQCVKQLCSSCPQFRCSVCTLTYCREHLIRLGTDEVCRECGRILREEAERELAECDDCGHPLSRHGDKHGCEYERGDVLKSCKDGGDVMSAAGPCGCQWGRRV